MKKILCFDVSNNSCFVAIAEGTNVLSYKQELKPSIQAETLFVMIEECLQETKLSYDDLDYLAVTVGPGSFTGIRIGLAAAKGILYTKKNIKPIAVTNFETSLYRLKMQVKKFDSAIIIINAYRDQCYVQQFYCDNQTSEPILMDCVDIPEYITSLKGKISCAGSGLSQIYTKIKNIENLTILPRFPIIRALHIVRYCNSKIKSGNLGKIEPLYIRKPDATPQVT